jgi:hypothetical protein
MKLEQEPPNKPNFLAVVLMAGAALIVIFIIAWVILRWGGGARFLNKTERKVPTSQLILPARAPFAPHSPVGQDSLLLGINPSHDQSS